MIDFTVTGLLDTPLIRKAVEIAYRDFIENYGKILCELPDVMKERALDALQAQNIDECFINGPLKLPRLLAQAGVCEQLIVAAIIQDGLRNNPALAEKLEPDVITKTKSITEYDRRIQDRLLCINTKVMDSYRGKTEGDASEEQNFPIRAVTESVTTHFEKAAPDIVETDPDLKKLLKAQIICVLDDFEVIARQDNTMLAMTLPGLLVLADTLVEKSPDFLDQRLQEFINKTKIRLNSVSAIANNRSFLKAVT